MQSHAESQENHACQKTNKHWNYVRKQVKKSYFTFQGRKKELSNFLKKYVYGQKKSHARIRLQKSKMVQITQKVYFYIQKIS